MVSYLSGSKIFISKESDKLEITLYEKEKSKSDTASQEETFDSKTFQPPVPVGIKYLRIEEVTEDNKVGYTQSKILFNLKNIPGLFLKDGSEFTMLKPGQEIEKNSREIAVIYQFFKVGKGKDWRFILEIVDLSELSNHSLFTVNMQVTSLTTLNIEIRCFSLTEDNVDGMIEKKCVPNNNAELELKKSIGVVNFVNGGSEAVGSEFDNESNLTWKKEFAGPMEGFALAIDGMRTIICDEGIHSYVSWKTGVSIQNIKRKLNFPMSTINPFKLESFGAKRAI